MSDNFVTIATFAKSVEAEIVRGRLEAEGIETQIPPSLSNAYFGSAAPLGGVELQVRESETALAQAILQRTDEPLAEGEFAPRCPACGSAEVTAEEPKTGLGAFVASLLTEAPSEHDEWTFTCQACGRVWRE